MWKGKDVWIYEWKDGKMWGSGEVAVHGLNGRKEGSGKKIPGNVEKCEYVVNKRVKMGKCVEKEINKKMCRETGRRK